MGNPKDFPYANPMGWHYTSREGAEGEWTCEHDKNKSRPIMGTLRCPYGRNRRFLPLMGWVPYPPHMGPRFAGPITALRAFKKRNRSNIVLRGTRSWKTKTDNSGQNTHELGENMRLHVSSQNLVEGCDGEENRQISSNPSKMGKSGQKHVKTGNSGQNVQF